MWSAGLVRSAEIEGETKTRSDSHRRTCEFFINQQSELFSLMVFGTITLKSMNELLSLKCQKIIKTVHVAGFV